MARLYMSIFTALIMLFLTLASGIGLLVFGKQFPYKGFYAGTAEISVRHNFGGLPLTPPCRMLSLLLMYAYTSINRRQTCRRMNQPSTSNGPGDAFSGTTGRGEFGQPGHRFYLLSKQKVTTTSAGSKNQSSGLGLQAVTVQIFFYCSVAVQPPVRQPQLSLP
ncbi:hypothetical protein FJ875_09890 [Salmonella enterica]|nr:hypothetical protein [Salmonella enterica]